MLTLLLLFALKITTPGEMACVGSVKESAVPMDLYIAGVEEEGTMTLVSQNQILYLNGPGVSGLKPGSIQRVIRPEGKVQDPNTGGKRGIYYMDIGTIKIETVQDGSATARVLVSCQEMFKGDLVVPHTPVPALEFGESLSTELTQIPPNGLVSSILFGKDDVREMVAGQFCFIGVGGRDGVKVGDRFTVFRPNPPFDSKDMIASTPRSWLSYPSARDASFGSKVSGLLDNRKLPPVILGDLVVVDAGDGVAACKIVNSLSEIQRGDLIVKR